MWSTALALYDRQTELLRQLYGKDHFRLSQARILAINTSVVTLISVAIAIGLALMNPEIYATRSKFLLVPLLVGLAIAMVLAYRALMQGRDKRAGGIVASAVSLVIVCSIILTGGFPKAPGSPILILPPIISYCIYGARVGRWMAIVTPIFAFLSWLLQNYWHLPIPDLASPINPQFNTAVWMIATYSIAVLVVSSYEHSNRLLSLQLDQERERHSELANVDWLTGLKNARYFEEELQRASLRRRSSDKHMAVIYCDLDDFKPINDSFGHAIGDQILATIGQRLQSLTRQNSDIAARIGGDEFAILLPECAMSGLSMICDRIRASVQEPIIVEGHSYQVGISVGYALSKGPDEAVSQLLSRADESMYKDKQRKSGPSRMRPTA